MIFFFFFVHNMKEQWGKAAGKHRTNPLNDLLRQSSVLALRIPTNPCLLAFHPGIPVQWKERFLGSPSLYIFWLITTAGLEQSLWQYFPGPPQNPTSPLGMRRGLCGFPRRQRLEREREPSSRAWLRPPLSPGAAATAEGFASGPLERGGIRAPVLESPGIQPEIPASCGV